MNRRRIKVNFLSSRWVTIIAFIIIVYAAFGLVKITWQNYQVNQKISSLQDEIKKSDEENFELKNKIDYYKTDAYKERQAREELNLQKPGEIVIVIPNNSQNEVNTKKKEETKTNEKSDYRSNIQKWREYFFGNK